MDPSTSYLQGSQDLVNIVPDGVSDKVDASHRVFIRAAQTSIKAYPQYNEHLMVQRRSIVAIPRTHTFVILYSLRR